MDRKITKFNNVESVFDLGLVNFIPHPTDPDYIVFRFVDLKRADEFERRLTEEKIWFERGENPSRTKQRTYYLFGVHQKNYERVQQINYEIEGKNRHFIIKNNLFRWGLLIITFGILALALFGYCQRMNKLNDQTLTHKVENE